MSSFNERILKFFACICVLIGTFLVFMNPAQSIVPCKEIADKIGNLGIKSALKTFAHYSERQYAFTPLVRKIPETEEKIGLIVDAGVTISEAWLGSPVPRNVIPLPEAVTKRELKKNSKFLIFLSSDP